MDLFILLTRLAISCSINKFQICCYYQMCRMRRQTNVESFVRLQLTGALKGGRCAAISNMQQPEETTHVL